MVIDSIGRYDVLDEVGQGGMATVYRATDPQSGAVVAVKLMARELTRDARFRKRFQREADILRRLRLPGIGSVVDYGEYDDQPYLVTPYYSGGTLADRLAHGPLAPSEIAAVISRVAEALDGAHIRGLVHRDVKPTNILFDSGGRRI